jgi:hypothetical protein
LVVFHGRRRRCQPRCHAHTGGRRRRTHGGGGDTR